MKRIICSNILNSNYNWIMSNYLRNYPRILNSSKTIINLEDTIRNFVTSPLIYTEKSIRVTKETNVESILKLPVPELDVTLGKYLRSVKPLLTQTQFKETTNVVKEFGSPNGIGPKLQKLLVERAKDYDNWLSDWWLRSAYLENRAPVPVFSSPGLIFPSENYNKIEDQLRYAAILIYGALKYKQAVDQGGIPQEKMGNFLLDMSQYTKVFGTNRSPGITCDELKYHPNSQHYVVAYKNYFFKVPSYSSTEGQILEPTEILRQLYYIIGATSGLSGIPFGVLTSENRDTWGRVHNILRRDDLNDETVKALEEAHFLVCIDRPNRPLKQPKGTTELFAVEDLELSEKQTVAAIQMMHGNRTNSGNRWFDKTIQFIVGREGECGLTYEHSPAEGPPIANMMDFILKNKEKIGETLNNFTEEDPTYIPNKLPFNITRELSTYISEANENLGKLVDDLDMACFTFRKYGKDLIKNCKFSPDSYIQMAVQSAFHRVHKVPGAHYESASTRIFKDGRTETIRSCSSESLEFAEAINNSGSSKQLKYEKMKKAIDNHKNDASEAVKGYGVDRHLLGLKLVAKENGMAIPKLFTDAGFTKSTYFRLSTSQVSSVNQAFMCYGPLVTDGYGCCYNPRSNEIDFGISAFNSSDATNAERFKISLQEVLLEMGDVASEITSKL